MAISPNIPLVRNTGEFIDIPYAHPKEATMLYAEEVGIITANRDRRLLPYDTVTRASFLVMLSRAFHLPSERTIPYTDVVGSSWYAEYVGIAATYRLFVLQDPTKLEPETLVTIADVNRALLLITTLKKGDNRAVHIETTPMIKSSTAPVLYTVASVRRQKIPLMQSSSIATKKPLVRRTSLVRPISILEKRTIILTMINAIRREHGLRELTQDIRLEKSAQTYADRMIAEGFFGHIAPDGQNVQIRIDATGFSDKTFRQDCRCTPGYALGENLAKGQKTPEEAVADWMKSPSHKAAILNPAYTHTGIGLNAGIWVEHFGGLVLP